MTLAKKRTPQTIPSQVLLRLGVQAVHSTIQRAKLLLAKDEENLLREVSTGKIDNVTRDIDKFSEINAKGILYHGLARTSYRDSLVVWGEESINGQPDLDLSKESRTVVLLDMIDGTDLVNRKVSNWCSALVFYYPPEKKILGAVVGLPSGHYYCAGCDRGAYVLKVKTTSEEIPADQLIEYDLHSPASTGDLRRATVCFYGQKASNLLSVTSSAWVPEGAKEKAANPYAFHKFLGEIHALPNKERPPFRLLNLGGNPMMVKVADGTIDAVFELVGQKPHDVVPGAFIARRAGAVVRGLHGEPLNLEKALLHPNEGHLTYIIAPNERLFRELQQRIMGTSPNS